MLLWLVIVNNRYAFNEWIRPARWCVFSIVCGGVVFGSGLYASDDAAGVGDLADVDRDTPAIERPFNSPPAHAPGAHLRHRQPNVRPNVRRGGALPGVDYLGAFGEFPAKPVGELLALADAFADTTTAMVPAAAEYAASCDSSDGASKLTSDEKHAEFKELMGSPTGKRAHTHSSAIPKKMRVLFHLTEAAKVAQTPGEITDTIAVLPWELRAKFAFPEHEGDDDSRLTFVQNRLIAAMQHECELMRKESAAAKPEVEETSCGCSCCCQ